MDGTIIVELTQHDQGAIRWVLTVVVATVAAWILLTELALGLGEAINVQQGGIASPGQWLRITMFVLLALVGPSCAILIWRASRRQNHGVAPSLRRSALGAAAGLVALVPLLILSAI